jgi:large subunit ribosomal protein L22
MTGPKTNEGQHSHADEIGTRAHLNTARFSAWKARVVLDLIRGESVRNADQILQLTERGAADVIRKVLASAVANAVNNDNQIADELFVSACFADEGPTMKRFRPRARGRGSRILKRTCHITVIVRRLEDATIERMRNAAEASGRGATPAQSRAARVARSRQAAAEETAVEETAVETTEDVDTAVATGFVAGSYAGSALPLADGSAPEGYTIKGNADSMKFHTTESRWYKVTKAEVWFDTAESAVAAGFVDAMDSVGGGDEGVEEIAPGPYGVGSASPLDDGSAPAGFDIKGNADSMKFHTTDSPWYGRTKAEVWFNTAEAAVAAGFVDAMAGKGATEDDAAASTGEEA